MHNILGSQKMKFVVSCRGIIEAKDAADFAKRFITFCGMTSARRGRIDKYPFKGGGGNGYTGFFPLMESYLMIDVYSDLNETEILLSTCKPERIDRGALISFVTKEIGPLIQIY